MYATIYCMQQCFFFLEVVLETYMGMKAFSAKREDQKQVSIRRNLFNAAVSIVLSLPRSLSCVDGACDR